MPPLFDISPFNNQTDAKKIEAECQRREGNIYRKVWHELVELIKRLPSKETLEKRGELLVDTSNSIVKIGSPGLLHEEEQALLEQVLKKLKPWRKGPFEFFGIEVDAEWRSDKKWDRISEHIGDLKNARVADIGCGNGYYMLRLLEHNPRYVIGFDPSEQFWFMFSLIQRYVSNPKLQYQLLGVEHIGWYPKFFNLVLCMGVIYHQRDPLTMLRNIYDSLRPGGRLILEGLTIPGKEPVALCLADRFAQMRNVYYVPTAEAMVAWVKKIGFVNISVFSEVELTSEEQRTTKYGSERSLKDYLDPNDPTLTVEGYPAPKRAALIAERPV